MLTKEEKRTRWGDGPWVDEPDRVEWRAHGFPVLIRRGGFGILCGYVAVPPGHPWHGLAIDDLSRHVHAHGGINYAAPCQGDDVCHVPDAGESDHIWWVGFDCGHGFDLIPEIHKLLPDLESHTGVDPAFAVRYRDLAYVKAEAEALALQASIAGGGSDR